MLQANPDIDIVWAANEGGLVGAITARRASGADIAIFGTDMSLQVAGALLDSTSGVKAVSTQDPYSIGYQSVELALQKIGGGEAPKEAMVPLEMYSADKPEAVNAYLEKYKALAK